MCEFDKPLIFQFSDNSFCHILPLASLNCFIICHYGRVFRTYEFSSYVFLNILKYNARDWQNAIDNFTFIELAKY